MTNRQAAVELAESGLLGDLLEEEIDNIEGALNEAERRGMLRAAGIADGLVCQRQVPSPFEVGFNTACGDVARSIRAAAEKIGE